MDGISEQEKPDFEGVKQQLTDAIDKMDEIKHLRETTLVCSLHKGILDPFVNDCHAIGIRSISNIPLVKTKYSEG